MKVVDLTGMVFGKLTVIGRSPSERYTAWLCRCECGVTKSVIGTNLTRGCTKSCGGCVSRKKDILGKIFGRLTVVAYAGGNDNKNAVWECRCECDRTCTVSGVALRRGDTRSCGCLRSDTVSETMSGENHYNWKCGEFNFGSKCWANRILKGAVYTAKKNGYLPPAISADELANLATSSNGTCGICGKHCLGKNGEFCLDHCHETGVVRGYLCRTCNWVLGYYGNNPDLLRNAAAWLELTSQTTS